MEELGIGGGLSGFCCSDRCFGAIFFGDFFSGGDRYYDDRWRERSYKQDFSSAETAIIWPWEYQTIYEKHSSMTFDGTEYGTRANAIGEDLLGEVLGTCTAKNYDIYSDTTYTEEFEVRKINGVAQEYLVAVGLEDVFYVYIWQVLSECGVATRVEDEDTWMWGLVERNYLSFTITSEALGIYKKALYITEDGYLWTNLAEYAYLYDIGVDAAQEIISYVKDNSTEAEFEPYEYRLAGNLTAIEEGYVLIDDSILCRNPKEGMVFKVPTDDIRIRRCIEFAGLKEGDIVVVSFRGEIDVDAGNVINGAVSVDQGFLHDGHVAVPE